MPQSLQRPSWRRWLRHRWIDSRDVQRLLPPQAIERLEAQVRASEASHAGELCVAVEGGLPHGYLRQHLHARDRAVTLFGKLRVWDTPGNNGVLIYLLLADRAIEIVADRGLNAQVSAAQWQAIVAQLRAALQSGAYERGLSEAVQAVDALLRQYCPLPAGERKANALPDAVVLL